VVTARAIAKAVPVTIPAVGTAEPLQTVEIRAQVTGQLSQIHFREGQDVRKGAPLFTLDARPFEAALQQAQAVLARDSAQFKNAQSQRARYEDLFKRGLIPRDRGDPRCRSGADRKRQTEPPVHAYPCADLRANRRARRARGGSGPSERHHTAGGDQPGRAD
jgi:multidrug efflux pump subunit AcrA (membrane-fusion protein)